MMNTMFDNSELELLKETLATILDDFDNSEYPAVETIDNVHYFWRRLQTPNETKVQTRQLTLIKKEDFK